MIDTEKMKALAADLRKGSCGRYRWYAMGRDETSYFMDFDWGYDADRWFSDQQKSRAAWIEQEGIHIVKKLFQTELETNATAAADAIDTLLAALEAATRERDELIHDNAQLVKSASAEATRADELRADLEAAAADKRDAERYRFLKRQAKSDPKMNGQHVWYSIPMRNPNGGTLTGNTLDDAIDAALSQRQEES